MEIDDWGIRSVDRDQDGFIILRPKKQLPGFTDFCAAEIEETKELVFHHGYVAIRGYHMGDNQAFEKAMSVWDPVYFKYRLLGAYYVESQHELRVNRGIDYRLLKQYFGNYPMRVVNDAFKARDIEIELTTPPRSDFQRTALTFMAAQGIYERNRKYTQEIIDADTGEGKSQPDDTLIPTPKGYRRLDSLAIGDTVFNVHGEPVKILKVYPQRGLQKTYRVTFSDGRSTRCNPEHLWRIAGPDHITKVLPLSNIIEDYKNNPSLRYSVDHIGPVQYPYQEVGNQSIFGKTNPSIPDYYKYNIVAIRKISLKCIIDAFRYIEYANGVELVIPDDYSNLQNDTIELARSLGHIVYTNKTTHALTVNINYQLDDLYITKIEEVEPTTQRCILIDDPEHIYITEDYIPTHNTYCGVGITAYYHSPVVIIVPISKLMNQWKQSFLSFTTLTEDDIMLVQGGKACMKIIDGKCKDKKVFIMMSDTLSSFQKQYGDEKTTELLRATNAYIKIVDEVHRDMKTNSMIEALSNFHMNYYMSASRDRSERKESWIFRSLFKNVPRFGSDFKTQDEKHLNIMIKKYYWTPDVMQIRAMVNPRTGLNTKAYERELINATKEQRQSFDDALRTMLNWSKKLLKPKNKLMILAQSIDTLYYLQNIVEEVFPGESAVYYGGMKKPDKEVALTYRIIIATTSSMGTGADIPGLQHVYNVSTYANKIDAVQISGRCRPLKDGTPVVYIEFLNAGYVKTMRQYERRRPYLVNRTKSGKLVVVN